MAPTPSACPDDFRLTDRVRALLETHHVAGARLCLGLSGGLDSSVLLHVLAGLRHRLGFQLRAVHVHHGLSPRADEWLRHCQAACQALAVPLDVAHVEVRREGKGVEAAARKARYAVFARQPADFIVLGHHLDDQAETVLLHLLRGSGVRGLAAMPVRRALAGSAAKVLRPMLGIGREALMEHAARHDLVWVEDESNLDTGFARNFLRRDVMPLLRRRYPACRECLSRTAAHMAASAELLDDLARLDLGAAVDRADTLDLALLSGLTPGRAGNLLRYFLRQQGLGTPSTAAVEALLDQLSSRERSPDRAILWRLSDTALRVWRGRLHVTRLADLSGSPCLTWHGEAALEFAGGHLRFESITGQGLRLASVGGRPISLRLRQGGERLCPDASRPRRALKKLLQETDVPPWERGRLPLLYVGDELAWVAGVGLDVRFQAQAREPGLLIGWQPRSPHP